MAVELDDDVAGLARVSYGIALVVQVGYLLGWVGAGIWVLLAVGPLAGIATVAGIYLAGSLPVLTLTTESPFVTDQDSEAVREALGRLGSPAGTYWVLWADEIAEETVEDGRRYELRQSSLGLFDRELVVHLREEPDEGIAYRAGDGDRTATVRLLVHDEDGGTAVRVRSSVDRARPRHLLATLLQSPVQRRIWERSGYRERSSSLDVGR